MTDDPQQFDRRLIDEIEHGSGDYTDVELLDQAQLNAQAMLLGTVEILNGHPNVLATWRQGLAEIFARGWDAERDWSANEILDALLTNYRSFGALVIEHDEAADPPTARLVDLPDPELVHGLQLDPAYIEELMKIGAMLTRHLGGVLDWTIEPDTGEILLTVRLAGDVG
jgi:hypothetical protein